MKSGKSAVKVAFFALNLETWANPVRARLVLRPERRQSQGSGRDHERCLSHGSRSLLLLGLERGAAAALDVISHGGQAGGTEWQA